MGARLAETREQLAARTREAEAARADRDGLAASLAAVQQDKAHLEQTLASHQRAAREAEPTLAALRASQEELEQAATTARAEKERLGAECARLQADLEQTQQTLAALTSRQAQGEAREAETQHEAQRLRETLEATAAERHEAVERLRVNTTELNATQVRHERPFGVL